VEKWFGVIGVLLGLATMHPAAHAAPADHQVQHLTVTLLSTMLADDGIGEWGFAALIAADGEKLLVDTGARPDTVLGNAAELGIDLTPVHQVVLTHFHADHVGGLMTLRKALAVRDEAALSTAHVATGIFYSRPLAGGGEANSMIALRPSFEATGGHFVEHDGMTEIMPGLWLSGPVPRPNLERNWSRSGTVVTPAGEVEDTVPDDQSVIIDTPQGLVIITGCGHAGIVNILAAVDAKFSHRPVLAIIGGLHLFAASDAQIEWTAEKMKNSGVRTLIGAHCTGLESLYRLRTLIGLSRETAVVGAVGASFTLGTGIHPGRIAQ
jgi:7,8-dihydropterin-6-yl-methyl-4-(beta-D-ribofuranosyl)aminobenzene 5'-phosphate synthase